MRKSLLLMVCAALAALFSSCGNKEPWRLSPREAKLVGEWKATDEDIRVLKNGSPVEVEVPELERIVDWHYEFEDSGRGSGSEHYLSGGDETVDYHFLWNLTNDRIRFAHMEYDDEDKHQHSSRLPLGFMHREYEVEKLTSDRLVLTCEDIWRVGDTEFDMITTYFFDKVE